MRREANARPPTAAWRDLGTGQPLLLDGLLGNARALAARAEVLALDEERVLSPTKAEGSGPRCMWLSKELLDPAIGAVVDLMDAAIATLNDRGELGTGELEALLSLEDTATSDAPAQPDRRGPDPRCIATIYYANEWRPGDGGELVLYDDAGRCTRVIEPLADRLVVFVTQTPHALRPIVRGPHVSITGYLRRPV
ncbi:MAG: 2OG-Fe(II) oxygenase [Nannocystaceae bacterium]|nr:2OG-Fe(II) oxygenase [bacterium]